MLDSALNLLSSCFFGRRRRLDTDLSDCRFVKAMPRGRETRAIPLGPVKQSGSQFSSEHTRKNGNLAHRQHCKPTGNRMEWRPKPPRVATSNCCRDYIWSGHERNKQRQRSPPQQSTAAGYIFDSSDLKREMARSALALVVAAILLATAQAKGFYYTYEDLASEDSMWALYERWVAHHKAHHKVVRDHGEMTRRFPTFKNRVLRKVSIHPNLARKKLGINVFGDMTDEEIIKFTSCNCWD